MRIRLRLAWHLALVGTALAVPALAQSGATSTYATACTKTPSGGDQDAAHASFTLGKKAYDEADYPKSIRYLKDAYELDCTKPDLLKYISSAYVAKGEKAEAIAALEAYVKASPKAGDLDVVQKKIANLKQQMAATPASATTASATATGTTASSATGVGTAEPPPPAGSTRTHTIYPWLVVGGGAALGVVGGIMIGVGAAKISDSFKGCTSVGATYDCGSAQRNAAAQSANNSGHTVQNVGIAFAVLGAAAIAGGLVWHFLEPTGSAAQARIRFLPAIGPAYAGLAAGGTF